VNEEVIEASDDFDRNGNGEKRADSYMF
jgi:hypothetical protein